MLAGSQLGCLKEVLVIAAALESNDPRVVPHNEQHRARQYHRMHPEAESDFLVLLFIWNDYCEQTPDLSRRELQRWCEERFLSPLRMREWSDLHRQLGRLSHGAGLAENTDAADESTIHKALLAGFLGHVAQLDNQGFYRGARNKIIFLWPASRLARRHKRWVMAAELSQTSRVYARHVAAIRPEWIDEVAPHQLRYSHAEPKWSPRDGKVIALESATLWGLKVISGRRVNYGQIKPAEARAIFVQDGLAGDEVESALKFVTANRALRRELEIEEQKLRCPGMLLVRENIVAFFEKRIPPGVVDVITLEKWLSGSNSQDSESLFLDRSDITGVIKGASSEDYPDWWFAGESRLPLYYAYNPGGEDDGITLEVPLYLINQLHAGAVERLVPGLLKDKLLALLKSLPKGLRRQLVPLPDAVAGLLNPVAQDKSPLIESLVGAIRQEFDVSVKKEDFNEKEIPTELTMRVVVISDHSRVIDSGRDVKALKSKHGGRAEASFGKALAPELTVSGWKDWDFGDLPERIVARIGGSKVTAYPALVDEGNTVGVEIFDTPRNAAASQRLGLYRLLLLQLPDQRRLMNRIPDLDRLCLLFVMIGSCRELRTDIEGAVMDRVFHTDTTSIRNRVVFEELKEHGRTEIGRHLEDIRKLILDILTEYQIVRQSLTNTNYLDPEAVSDIEQQLAHLVFSGFLTSTPQSWLPHVPRFLSGITIRLSKAMQMPNTEKTRARKLRPYVKYLDELCHSTTNSIRYLEYRWMLEELRVSVFAQELGTSRPVSATRLKNIISKV